MRGNSEATRRLTPAVPEGRDLRNRKLQPDEGKLWVWVAALALLSACDLDDGSEVGRPSPPPVPQVAVEQDSSGVRIVTTPASRAERTLGWTVGTNPEILIGTGSDDAEQFFRIRGVAEGPDGRLVVVDGGSAEIRFFDADGRFSHWTGGKGEGPGEFQDPVLLGILPGDSLLIFDGSLRRFHVMSVRDGGSRALRPEGWPTGEPPTGIVGTRVLTSVTFSLQPPPGPGLSVARVDYRWISIVTGTASTIVSFEFPRAYFPDGPPNAHSVPFRNVRPPSAVSSDHAFITHRDPEIHVYDTLGALRRILRVEGMSTPITPAMIEDEVRRRAALSSFTEARIREVYESMPLPDSHPAFAALRLDANGWLWARIFDPDPDAPNRWVIFDLDGRAHGSVELPIGFTPQDIRDASLLGVWVDEAGVEHVARYALERTGSVEGSR